MCPLCKKGDRKEIKNYRPVALLSVAGMVLEKIISMQMEVCFERNKLFGEFRFGFRKNRSTITELITLFDKLLEAKEEGKEIAVLLYDLPAAFDTVCPKILGEKLKLYGFDDNAMRWIKSFLSERKQSVVINDKISSFIDLGSNATLNGIEKQLYIADIIINKSHFIFIESF